MRALALTSLRLLPLLSWRLLYHRVFLYQKADSQLAMQADANCDALATEELISACLGSGLCPHQAFRLQQQLPARLITHPLKRSSFYVKWWELVNSTADSFIEKAKLAVAANKGCIGLSVDGGCIKSLCIKGLFVVLHVGNMNIPLPPFLGDSRAYIISRREKT
eukprot:PhM_4_TR8434/c3_g1_i4/m.4111